jgi:RNA polymerase sigma-70 factor, ECF subfamily
MPRSPRHVSNLGRQTMDRNTIEQLYVRFGPMVLRRSRRLLGDETAARDAMQEVFVRALRTVGGFRSDASPATWLYRIATNYCLNLLRDEARRAQLWSRYGAVVTSVVQAPGEARVHISQILSAVRPELQEIAFYHFIDELKQEEIADLLGVSRRTVGNRLDELRTAVLQLEMISEVS